MHVLIHALNTFFLLLFRPLNAIPRFWGLLAASIITGLIMIAIAARTSNQEKLASVKNQLKADLLAMRLYQYDVSVMVRAMSGLFSNNLRYMAHLLRPMVFLVLPISLIMIQLSAHYQYRPAAADEPLLISARYDTGTDPLSVCITSPQSMVTGPVRVPSEETIFWRIQPPDTAGTVVIAFSVDSTMMQVPISVSSQKGALGSNLYRSGDVRSLLDPAAPVLPSTQAIRHIRIHYHTAYIPVGNLKIHWLPFFFIVSILAGLVFKKLFGVTL